MANRNNSSLTRQAGDMYQVWLASNALRLQRYKQARSANQMSRKFLWEFVSSSSAFWRIAVCKHTVKILLISTNSNISMFGFVGCSQLSRVVSRRYLPTWLAVGRGNTSMVQIKLSTCRNQTKIWHRKSSCVLLQASQTVSEHITADSMIRYFSSNFCQ